MAPNDSDSGLEKLMKEHGRWVLGKHEETYQKLCEQKKQRLGLGE